MFLNRWNKREQTANTRHRSSTEMLSHGDGHVRGQTSRRLEWRGHCTERDMARGRGSRHCRSTYPHPTICSSVQEKLAKGAANLAEQALIAVWWPRRRPCSSRGACRCRVRQFAASLRRPASVGARTPWGRDGWRAGMRRTRVKRKCPGQNTALKPTNSNSISGAGEPASQAGSSISKVNLPNTAGVTISHTNSGPRIKYFCSFGQQTLTQR